MSTKPSPTQNDAVEKVVRILRNHERLVKALREMLKMANESDVDWAGALVREQTRALLSELEQEEQK